MLIFYKEGSSRADNVMKLVGVDLRGALTRTVPICVYPSPTLGGLTTICVTVAPTKPLNCTPYRIPTSNFIYTQTSQLSIIPVNNYDILPLHDSTPYNPLVFVFGFPTNPTLSIHSSVIHSYCPCRDAHAKAIHRGCNAECIARCEGQ